MTFTNYVSEIAQINTQSRLKAITDVLDKNAVDYRFQENYGCKNLIVEQRNGIGPKYVLSAHYDNFPGTPGANDNASACCILLNLILNLKNAKYNIDYVFFDKEESGMVGSRYYLSQNDNKEIKTVVNLDMCGMGSNTVLSFDNEMAGDNQVESKIVNNNEVIRIGKIPPGDACTFIGAGIQTIYIINSTERDLEWYNNFAAIDSFNGYMYTDWFSTMHKPSDTVDTINPEQIEKIFRLICSAFSS